MKDRFILVAVVAYLCFSVQASNGQSIPNPPINVTASWSVAEDAVVNVAWEAPQSLPLGDLLTYVVYAAEGNCTTQQNLAWKEVAQTGDKHTALSVQTLGLSSPGTVSFIVYSQLSLLRSNASDSAVAEWMGTAGRGDTIVFRTQPALNATIGMAYVYHAFAGHTDLNRVEAVTYSLRAAPSGMSIDAQSGVVTWIPSQPGMDVVSIVASASTGAVAQQDYTVTVSNRNGYVSGSVRDSVTGRAIVGAIVSFELEGNSQSRVQTLSGNDGSFSMRLDEGQYTVRADAEGYIPQYWDGVSASGGAKMLAIHGGDSLPSSINFHLSKVGITLSVGGTELSEAGFSLSQNYPNPLAPSNGFATTIEYIVDRSADVALDIYSLAGVKMAALVRGEQTPGRHAVAFNGERLPTGTYFYQLIVGEKKLTRRLVIRQ